MEAADWVVVLFVMGLLFVLGVTTGQLIYKPEYEEIASEVASEHTYSPAYKCADFSNDLVKALREQGYFAMEKTVELEDYNGLHSITLLILPIESVTGEILSPERWKEGGYSFFGDAYDCQRCMKIVKEAINCPEKEGFVEGYSLETGLCEYWDK